MRCRHALLALLAPVVSSAAQSCETVVYCSKGQAFSDANFTHAENKTCAVACGGNCCFGGDKVCDDGRFAVCADDGDGSCNGTDACNSIGIARNEYWSDADGVVLISGGSCVGREACKHLSTDEGSVQSISSSCVGAEACREVGSQGSVGSLSNSCNGKDSCYRVGASGKVGDISNSCQGESACLNVGEEHGTVGDISNSCEGEFACQYVGDWWGKIGDISDNSCKGKHACDNAASGGKIDSISNSCQGGWACYETGYGGDAGNVTNSCVGYNACYYVAYAGRFGDITDSCHGDSACDGFAWDNTDNSLSLDNCCNAERLCKNLEYGTNTSSRHTPFNPLRTCASLVEPGNCIAALTYEDCGNVSESMGYKWIENPVPIQDKLIPHMPGGCFAKRKNAKDEIVKIRYNLNGDPGTNCGAMTKNGKYTKLCVCGGVML